MMRLENETADEERGVLSMERWLGEAGREEAWSVHRGC